jgi:hypothetical protein
MGQQAAAFAIWRGQTRRISRLPIMLWDSTRKETGQLQSKESNRKNQNLILRATPMKPLKINGAAQNFSPYETGVPGIY